VLNWSGFYVGASIGARWEGANWTTTCLRPGVAGNICPGSVSDLPTRVGFNNPANFNSTSLRGGLYGGYNWQFGLAGLVGIEGDWAGGLNNSTNSPIPGADLPNSTGATGLDRASVKETWDAGIRGRLGYLPTRTLLLFGTAGVSWASLQASAFCGVANTAGWCAGGAPGFVGTTSTISKIATGWTVGAGVEWMYTLHWLFRAEYRYTDYGRLSGIFFPGINGAGVPNGDAIAAGVKLHTHTALLGIAYKFGGGLPLVGGY
jgi:outer membrane immunogenic protein